jgi:uncharacterized protein YndB with AHSA1/START domain
MSMAQVEQFTISRVLDAPRELVYQVSTEPKHLAHWLSPAGFNNIHAAMDLREGGSYHYGLEGPNGMQMWGKQAFRKIESNKSLSYIQTFSDKDGGVTRHPMVSSWPLEMLATTTFEDAGPGQTRMTISWQPHESDDAGNATFDSARPGMEGGFAGSFAKLEAYLAELTGAKT